MLVSKLNTLRKIYKSRGITGLLEATLSKIKIFRRTYNFNRVAREVASHLSEPISLEVYKRLSEGVYYIFGMGVEGDIAEFGTMSGRTAVALAAALNYCNKTLSDSDLRHGFKEPRKLWLFDSFEGLPQARTNLDQSSLHVASGIWGGGTALGISPESLLKLTSQYLQKEKIVIVKGWFKDTVPNIPESKKFALLHIDGDLYESAIDVLDSLFSRNMISKGASLFFDDWDCNAADPNFGERRAWREMVDRYCVKFSDLGSYGIAGHKFIIHEYTSIH